MLEITKILELHAIAIFFLFYWRLISQVTKGLNHKGFNQRRWNALNPNYQILSQLQLIILRFTNLKVNAKNCKIPTLTLCIHCIWFRNCSRSLIYPSQISHITNLAPAAGLWPGFNPAGNIFKLVQRLFDVDAAAGAFEWRGSGVMEILGCWLPVLCLFEFWAAACNEKFHQYLTRLLSCSTSTCVSLFVFTKTVLNLPEALWS